MKRLIPSLCALVMGVSFYCLPAVDTVLLETLKMVPDPLWKNTFNPRQRDQLYEPIMTDTAVTYKDYNLSLFFMRSADLDRKMSDMIDFSVGRVAMNKMLATKFDTDDRFEGWDEDDVDTEAKRVADGLTDMFTQMTFQEHRIGLGFEKEWNYKPWYFSVRTWGGLAERNYWIDEKGRETLTSLIADAFPELTGDFDLNNVMSLNWGLGDVHCKAGYAIDLHRNVSLLTGVRAVFPSSFNPDQPTKGELLPIKLDDFRDFLINRMKEILIEPLLGSAGHYAAGVWSRMTFATDLVVKETPVRFSVVGDVNADYYIPSTEHRYLTRTLKGETIPEGKIVEASDLTSGITDEQVRQYIGQFIIPEPVPLIVAPGTIANGSVTAKIELGDWSFYAGYDGYHKQAEVVDRFVDANDEALYVKPSLLGHSVKVGSKTVNVQESLRQNKTQHKLFGGFSYDIRLRNANLIFHKLDKLYLSFKVNGAASFSSQGMGDDFLVSVGFGCKI